MRRCKEPKEIATTFAFLVAQPINTGRRRSSDCGPSAQEATGGVSGQQQRCSNSPDAKFVVACSGEDRSIARDFSAAYANHLCPNRKKSGDDFAPHELRG